MAFFVAADVSRRMPADAGDAARAGGDAGDGAGYAAVQMAARRTPAPVAGDKPLQKAMAEVMKKMSMLRPAPHVRQGQAMIGK